MDDMGYMQVLDPSIFMQSGLNRILSARCWFTEALVGFAGATTVPAFSGWMGPLGCDGPHVPGVALLISLLPRPADAVVYRAHGEPGASGDLPGGLAAYPAVPRRTIPMAPPCAGSPRAHAATPRRLPHPNGRAPGQRGGGQCVTHAEGRVGGAKSRKNPARAP